MRSWETVKDAAEGSEFCGLLPQPMQFMVIDDLHPADFDLDLPIVGAEFERY
jgi:hypothetical protein